MQANQTLNLIIFIKSILLFIKIMDQLANLSNNFLTIIKAHHHFHFIFD
jgi:hypothetical protein